MAKIGIYPGAFDPVHDGHIAFALAAAKKHKLDRVFFLPEPIPRHKQGVKALEHRVMMVHLAVAAHPEFGVIVLEQPMFTVQETWPLLTARFDGSELYMLLGSDVAQRLASWPHIKKLIEAAPKFILALRGRTKQEVNTMIATMQETTKLLFSYSLLEADYPTHSSRKIRQSLKNGHVPRSLDPDVAQYIVDHRLYISGAT